MALLVSGRDPRGMDLRRWASVATLGLVFAAVCALPAQTMAAQPNQLLSPSVSPGAGTPATTFFFSVRYEGRDPATSIVATVGGQTVGLTLVSGTTSSGTYSGASQLPAGTWTVTFIADAERGNDPVAAGGTVQVVAPTPVPTPIPPPPAATPPPVVVVPAPTAPPAGQTPAPAGQTPAPAPSGAQASPADGTSPGSSGTPLASEAVPGTAGGGAFSAAPSAAPDGAGPISPQGFRGTEWLWPLLLGGLALIGLVGAWGLLLGARDRRRRQAEQAALVAAMPSTVLAADPERARAPAVWELDAQLEEERIGTVDFLPLGKEEATAEAPSVLATAFPEKRVSPRVARLEAARTIRPASSRRQLLEGAERPESV